MKNKNRYRFGHNIAHTKSPVILWPTTVEDSVIYLLPSLIKWELYNYISCITHNHINKYIINQWGIGLWRSIYLLSIYYDKCVVDAHRIVAWIAFEIDVFAIYVDVERHPSTVQMIMTADGNVDKKARPKLNCQNEGLLKQHFWLYLSRGLS